MAYSKTSQTTVNTEPGMETHVKAIKTRKSNRELTDELLKKTTFTVDPNLKSSDILPEKVLRAKKMFDNYYKTH